MKHRYSKSLAFFLLAVSMVMGMIVATVISPPSFAVSTIGALSDADSATAIVMPEPDRQQAATSSSQLVQDPPRRSSFRPDFSQGFPRSNQRSNFFMLRAFHDAVGDAWKSTVRISSSDHQVALGAIVGSDGWIISKSSELPMSGTILCQFHDGKTLDAVVVERVVDVDLALLHVEQADLPVVRWESSGIPDRGRWLATTDVQTVVPTAVGVVSAGVQMVKKANAVLGVHLESATAGASVSLVLPGSGAEEAGLKIGDSILAVNGQSVNSQKTFSAAIHGGIGGQVVTLLVNRSDREFEAEARLMDLATELHDETEMEVNGHVSARSSGFDRVFLHDTVLEPNQCGGPLVNLDGKVVGINIARAGRVSSYALPTDVVQPIVEGLIDRARVVSRSVETRSSLRPIR